VIAEGDERIEMFDPDSKHMPGNLKIGDITSDGFPDILMTIRKGNSTQTMQNYVHILQNRPCNENYCNPLMVKKQRRFFTLKQFSD
jgi:hypothetical protein